MARTGVPLREITIANLQTQLEELQDELLNHDHLSFGSQVLDGIVNGELRSKDFVTGSSGWLISADGSAELQNLIVGGSSTIGGWSINATSIYTGTEDHSEYTAATGDITIYSNGTDASIHAKEWYIDTSGILHCSSAVVEGAITTGASSDLDGQYLQALSVGKAAIIDLEVSKLVAGTIDSKSIVLAAASADVEIRSGINTGDFSNAGNKVGFIIGRDYSDNDLAKLYIGTSTQYLNFDGANTIIKGVINLIGSIQLKSFTEATLPATAGPTSDLAPSAIGTTNWTNPTNAYASDDSYATVTSTGVYQEYKTFGLGSPSSPIVPPGSTIDGIEVKIECQGDAADMEISVRLSWDTNTTWTSAKTDTPNNGSDTTLTFGASDDVWGHNWNTDEITDTYLVLDVQCSDLGSGTTLSVDAITIKIYYTTTVAAGSLIYVSDGEKAGETSSGTGVLAFLDENNNWIAIDSGNTINAGLGLKMPRLASDPSGSLGQIYFNTTDNIFKGYNTGWKELTMAMAYPSDTLQESDDTEEDINNPTYTEIKSITVDVAGRIKTKFDLRKKGGLGGTIAGKIYVNDAAVGEEHTTTLDSYTTFEDESIPVASGDTVEVYVKSVDSAEKQQVQNFRLYWDESTREYIDYQVDTKIGTFGNGSTTRAFDAASGTVNVAHGLGVTPLRVRVTAIFETEVRSFGVWDSSGNDCVKEYTDSGVEQFGASAKIVDVQNETTNPEIRSQSATLTVDGTNLIFAWTRTGTTASGTVYILWEAEGP